MRHRHQRICFYAAALLDLVVGRDDGCSVLSSYPLWRLDRMTAAGFNHRLVTTDKQAPDQERSNGDSKDCAKQHSTGSGQSCRLLFLIHLNYAVCLATQREHEIDTTDDAFAIFQVSDPVPRPRSVQEYHVLAGEMW